MRAPAGGRKLGGKYEIEPHPQEVSNLTAYPNKFLQKIYIAQTQRDEPKKEKIKKPHPNEPPPSPPPPCRTRRLRTGLRWCFIWFYIKTWTIDGRGCGIERDVVFGRQGGRKLEEESVRVNRPAVCM